MPGRADCLPGAGNRGVSEGLHSADYIIYRWKRIQNRAINAQMRPAATQRLQPGRLSAQQNEMWALQNGQVQSYFNGSLPPFPLKQPAIKRPLLSFWLWAEKRQSCPHLGEPVNEPAWPLRSYGHLGRSIRAVCGHVSAFEHIPAHKHPHKSFVITKVAAVKPLHHVWYGLLALARAVQRDRK